MYGPLAGLLVAKKASVRKGAAEKERGLQSRLCSQRRMLGLKWGEQNKPLDPGWGQMSPVALKAL